MNIILIFTYGVSLKNWDNSGLIQREILLYEKLHKMYGIKFIFITFGDEQDEKYKHIYDFIEVVPVYKYIERSKFEILNLIKVCLFSKKLKSLIKNPSLIKTNQMTGSILGIFLKRYLKIPFIVRTGYNIYDFSKYEKRRVLVRFFYFVLTQLTLLFSDTYLVTSYVDKYSLKSKFFTKNNIKVFPNWVVMPIRDKKKERYSNKILSIGRLENQKNYIELINKIKNSKYGLTIVGSGTLKNEIISKSKDLNIDLEIIDRVGYEEIFSVYQKYKIFISASSFEGNPKVVLEAMANGCLVIAKNNKNIKEIIRHKVNGILYSDDDDLNSIIKFYLNSESERLKIVSAAYKYIENNNLLDRLCEKEHEEYLRLLKN